MTQDELKALVGRAALEHVVHGTVVGVGTGSTVNHFIDALATLRSQVAGAAVDQCRLCPPEGMGGEQMWVQPETGNPLRR